MATRQKSQKSEIERELAQALADNRRLQARLDRLEAATETKTRKGSGTRAPRQTRGKQYETSFQDFLKERAIKREAAGKQSRRQKGVLTSKQNRELAKACDKLIAKEGLKGRVWVGGDMNAWREAARCIIDDGFTYVQAAEVFVDTFDEKAAQRALKARQSK